MLVALCCLLLLWSFNPWLPYLGMDNYAEFRWMQIGLLLAMLWHWLYRSLASPGLQNTSLNVPQSNSIWYTATQQPLPGVAFHDQYALQHYRHLLRRSSVVVLFGMSFTLFAYYVRPDAITQITSILTAEHTVQAPLNPLLWALHWCLLGLFGLYVARFFHPSTFLMTLKPLLITLLLCSAVLFSYMLVNIALSIAFEGRIDLFIVLIEFENIRMLNQFQILSIPLLVFGYQWTRQNAHHVSTGLAGQTIHNQDTLASTASRHDLGFYRWQYHLRQRLQPHLSTLACRLMPWLQPCLRFCLITSYFFIFLTAGRAAMLALLLFAGLLWIYQRQALKPQLCFALIALFIYQVIIRIQGYDYPLLRTDSSMRLEMWGELFANYPWQQLLWGYGGGNYPYLTRLVANAHPHNWMLQWLTDWGFIALMGFVGFCSVVWRCWLWSYRQQQINHHQNQINNAINESAPLADEKNPVAEVSFDLRSYIAMAWLMLLLYGFFDGVMVMPLPQLFFALYSGILLQPLWQNAAQLSRAQLSSADFNSAESHAANFKCAQRNTETYHTLRNTSAQSLALDGDDDANRTSAFSLGLRYLMLLLVFALSLLYLYLAMQSFFTTHALPSPFYGPNFWFIGDPV